MKNESMFNFNLAIGMSCLLTSLLYFIITWQINNLMMMIGAFGAVYLSVAGSQMVKSL